MKKFIISIFIILLSLPLYSMKLKWDLDKNERIEMVRTAGVRYYVNRSVQRVYEERNIIDLTCVEKFSDMYRVDGVFSVFEREGSDTVFKLKEKYAVDFGISPSGEFDVKRGDLMPNLRNIPSFPDKDLNPGDRWSANGELVIESFSKPFKLTFPVEYELARIVHENGKEIAVINYYYVIESDMTSAGYPDDFPVAIKGENKGVIYWDVVNNKPGDMKDSYYIAFLFARGGAQTLVEFTMNIRTENMTYKNYPEEQKEKDKEELKKELPEGTEVDTDDRGIVVRMDDVLFDFDSYSLRADTEGKLAKISEIIKERYPDREIIVEGHTDNVGKKDYNYSLSEKRARTVSEYLKAKVGHDKISYRGLGQDKPLADNNTTEGRKKNRRVEIIIKLK